MRQDCCKHFNGFREPYICEAGINMQTFRHEGKSVLRTLPCMNRDQPCRLREYPTKAEIAAYEADCEAMMHPVLMIDKAISEGQKTGSFVHEGCGGTITWRYDGPLAMRAKCDKCEWSGMS